MIKIDALYFLLILEILVVLLGSTVYFFFKNRKYKVMIQQAPQQSPEAKEPPTKKPAGEISPSGKDAKGILQRIVDLQKSTSLDLGKHKDLFEKALEKLALVQVENQGAQAQTKGLMEKPGKKEEIDEAIRQSEKNGKELETSVAALQDEKKGLFNILKTWEDEWKKRIEGSGILEAGDKIRNKEILKENEELKAQVDKLEKQLKENVDLLEKTKTQYSNLEKEYSILYHQQQEQKQESELKQGQKQEQKQESEQKQEQKPELKQESKQEQKKEEERKEEQEQKQEQKSEPTQEPKQEQKKDQPEDH